LGSLHVTIKGGCSRLSVFEVDTPTYFSSSYIILTFISSLSSSSHTCPARAIPYVAIVRFLIS